MPECCGRNFNANGMRNHLDHSAQHDDEIECGWCYARWPTHARKLRLQHEQSEHWYSCQDCEGIFETKKELEEHEDEAHPPNYCYGCQRQFQNPNNLNQVSRTTLWPQLPG